MMAGGPLAAGREHPPPPPPPHGALESIEMHPTEIFPKKERSIEFHFLIFVVVFTPTLCSFFLSNPIAHLLSKVLQNSLILKFARIPNFLKYCLSNSFYIPFVPIFISLQCFTFLLLLTVAFLTDSPVCTSNF